MVYKKWIRQSCHIIDYSFLVIVSHYHCLWFKCAFLYYIVCQNYNEN